MSQSNMFLYPKLAFTNLKKNANTYIPYILTCIGSIITFYTMITIANNEGLSKMPGADALKTILFLGTIVIAVFSFVFLFYTNSFLIKRRKKELGLYSILGLGKRHIAKVLFFETVFTSIISLGTGLFGGILFGKLMFLLLLNILKINTSIKFTISVFSIVFTIAFFGGIFLLTLLTNFIQVKLANPINLLKGGQIGEKEPKTSWLLTIIGVIALSAGYAISLTVKSPLTALLLFFVAVILVIIGTYALFTAGSIALLKLLKKNKNFFYKSKNFVSVSSMIYRMKQNAVGLANICILSTMVLVTISTTVSLYIGQKDMLRERFQFDISITAVDSTTDRKALDSLLVKESQDYHITIKDNIVYNHYSLRAFHQNNIFSPFEHEKTSIQNIYEKVCFIVVIPINEYNRLEKKSETLSDHEVLLFTNSTNYGKDTITIGTQDYKVKRELQSLCIESKKQKKSEIGESRYYLIVKDSAAAHAMCQSFDRDASDQSLKYAVMFNLDGKEDEILSFVKTFKNELTAIAPDATVESLHLMKTDWLSVYGGFLFLGVFLGALFMMATVLIIYFKQISEGYEDHNRFEIMRKVGMDNHEVKRTIHKQIMMIFFLPLISATIHITFAFRVITKMLHVFGLTNITLSLLCTIGTALGFAALYALVYSLTAKTYYKLVK